jgi:hypothetical protein
MIEPLVRLFRLPAKPRWRARAATGIDRHMTTRKSTAHRRAPHAPEPPSGGLRLKKYRPAPSDRRAKPRDGGRYGGGPRPKNLLVQPRDLFLEFCFIAPREPFLGKASGHIHLNADRDRST